MCDFLPRISACAISILFMSSRLENLLSSLATPTAYAVQAEADRLEALYSYQILDTPNEPAFDDLNKLAAFICGTPIAMISLIDTERQWFKARLGVSIPEMPRELAFCQHAPNKYEVFEVPDTTEHPIFHQHPGVVNDPYIRFYAGVQLITPEGLFIGSLCALDTVPRQLSHDQRTALLVLARQVMAHLELRRSQLKMAEEKEKIEDLLRLTTATNASFVGGRQEMFIKQDQRLVRVLMADVHYLEAFGDYVHLHTTRERLTIYGTLKELETRLPARDFARIHRKYIVRLDRIMTLEADSAVLDTARDGATRPPITVPIGNSYKTGLLQRLTLV